MFLTEPKLDFDFVEVQNISETEKFIPVLVNCPGKYQSSLGLLIDLYNYDKKFSDIDNYEVEDMGIQIVIFTIHGDEIELSEENIWRELFYNKEKL